MVEERRNTSREVFFEQLYDFIKDKIAQTTIQQYLNMFLSPPKFK